MGLMTCPKCGRAISEKANRCPNCGSFLQTIQQCEDCGLSYDAALPACPQCGCPNTIVAKKSHKKRVVVISVIVAVILAVVLAGIGVLNWARGVVYYTCMEDAVYSMLDSAVDAEKAGNLIHDVWSNSIFEKSDSATDPYTMENGSFVDFNDALANLLADEEFVDQIAKLETDCASISETMKLLKDPPSKYKEAYAALKEYYAKYTEFISMVSDPSGSLRSFTDDFNACDEELVQLYREMKQYLN